MAYRYLGPADLASVRPEPPARALVARAADVESWMGQVGAAVATFVVDAESRLWIADRHSEHVQCARSGDVLSAGEITFSLDGGGVAVVAVSNQSTGYCPEPASWPAVAAALDRAGLTHPGGFTTAFDFRRCPGCALIAIVKAGGYECAACGTPLPAAWNCDPMG